MNKKQLTPCSLLSALKFISLKSISTSKNIIKIGPLSLLPIQVCLPI